VNELALVRDDWLLLGAGSWDAGIKFEHDCQTKLIKVIACERLIGPTSRSALSSDIFLHNSYKFKTAGASLWRHSAWSVKVTNTTCLASSVTIHTYWVGFRYNCEINLCLPPSGLNQEFLPVSHSLYRRWLRRTAQWNKESCVKRVALESVGNSAVHPDTSSHRHYRNVRRDNP
jgi:hypothetical protein